METWLDRIQENNLFIKACPASLTEIENAEKQMGVKFAEDYKAFLARVGASICFGHEINGIVDSINLNVLNATAEMRIHVETIPHSWYVIENTHIDGIVICQDQYGTVYQAAPNMEPIKIADSLKAYLEVPEKAADHLERIDEMGREALNIKAVEAEEKLKDPDQVEKVLQQMEKKLEMIPGVGDWIADVPAVISLVRSYIRGEYSNIPIGSIIAAIAAIIYIVSPVDLIPDFIPGAGMLDDAAVFIACWKMIHDDVDKYQAWRKQTGREIE